MPRKLGRSKEQRFLCPACGYDELEEPAWSDPDAAGGGSLEICPELQDPDDDCAGGDPAQRRMIWREWVGSVRQRELLRRIR